MAADRWEALRAGTGTVRVRTMVAAVAVVGIALVAAALALVLSLRLALTREARVSAEVRAAEVARSLATGTPPGALAIGGDNLVVQILDTDGSVVAASEQAAGLPRLAAPAPGRPATVNVPFDDDDFIAVSVAAQTQRGEQTVVVLRSLDIVTDSTQAVVGLLAIGLPLLLLIIAATTWGMMGRALAPVEAMRAEADEVSAAALHRRVPQPAGTDEVARLAATMNRMLDRLQNAQIRQRRFVSDASHELRSPVATIRQHAEVALTHPDRIAVGQLAATVHAEALRLQHLVDDLLLMARLDERARLGCRPVDLDDIAFEEARRLRDTTALTVDTAHVSGGRISAEPAAARRLLRNLVDNAAQYARTTVALSLRERDGRVLLHVDDDGPGIPAPQRARVFDRFVRLDGARARDSGGAGLGLAIVVELVAAYGGTATVTDAPLGGARITVSLPALPD